MDQSNSDTKAGGGPAFLPIVVGSAQGCCPALHCFLPQMRDPSSNEPDYNCLAWTEVE